MSDLLTILSQTGYKPTAILHNRDIDFRNYKLRVARRKNIANAKKMENYLLNDESKKIEVQYTQRC